MQKWTFLLARLQCIVYVEIVPILIFEFESPEIGIGSIATERIVGVENALSIHDS